MVFEKCAFKALKLYWHDGEISRFTETFEGTFLLNLKKLWNYNRKLFLCPPQKQIGILNFLHKKDNHFFLKQYLFGLLFSRNAKKTHADQNILHAFWSVWKETTCDPSKATTAKNLFSSVYVAWCMLLVQLFSINVFYHIWQLDNIVFHKSCFYLLFFIVILRFFVIAMLLLSVIQVFWKKSVFYFLTPQ